jgi:hypothetical protein
MKPTLSQQAHQLSRIALTPAPLSLPAAFSEQLSSLYGLVQRSHHVFASPLGPLSARGRSFHLPRFAYFGPNSSDASLRLAFFGGLNHRDLRSTLALLHLIEGLAIKPDIGQGLNLSFYPLVDLLGLAGIAPARNLEAENWARTQVPELSLLEKDARLRGFHGFIRVESVSGDDLITVRLRSPARVEYPAPALELISSEDATPFAVRWESETVSSVADGPLAIAEDLPVQPFELTLQIPSFWPAELYSQAVASILKRFIIRHRGFISYAQHL